MQSASTSMVFSLNCHFVLQSPCNLFLILGKTPVCRGLNGNWLWWNAVRRGKERERIESVTRIICFGQNVRVLHEKLIWLPQTWTGFCFSPSVCIHLALTDLHREKQVQIIRGVYLIYLTYLAGTIRNFMARLHSVGLMGKSIGFQNTTTCSLMPYTLCVC